MGIAVKVDWAQSDAIICLFIYFSIVLSPALEKSIASHDGTKTQRSTFNLENSLCFAKVGSASL